MSSLLNTMQGSPRDAFFKAMEDVRAGMLGVAASDEGAAVGLQPMTHFPDAETGMIWFISSRQTDLVRRLPRSAPAQYVVISKDHDFHASVQGHLSQVDDALKLEEIWSPLADMGFPDGRDDADVVLLRFAPDQAQVWGSSNSVLRLGLELVQANLPGDHQKPDLGEHAAIDFRPV